jgi:hypothetical protein
VEICRAVRLEHGFQPAFFAVMLRRGSVGFASSTKCFLKSGITPRYSLVGIGRRSQANLVVNHRWTLGRQFGTRGSCWLGLPPLSSRCASERRLRWPVLIFELSSSIPDHGARECRLSRPPESKPPRKLGAALRAFTRAPKFRAAHQMPCAGSKAITVSLKSVFTTKADSQTDRRLRPRSAACD